MPDSPFLPIHAPAFGPSPSPERPRVVGWLVGVGEAVAAGERVCEVTLPGVLVEAESPADGTLVGIAVGLGDFVPDGSPLGWVEVRDA